MVLERDRDLGSPSFKIVSASAGSGKTYTLTLRYVQLLLSPYIPHNALKNILAITFTNLAAAEMRQRVLEMLKRVALGEKNAVAEVGRVVSLSEADLRLRARHVVDDILANFSDFQVRTIDSFLGQVFRASALEFGFNPEFEVTMSNQELVDYAFELYAKGIRPGSPVTEEFMKMADTITAITGRNKGYIWDPYSQIAQQVKKLQNVVASHQAEVRAVDYSGVIQEELQNARDLSRRIKEIVATHDATLGAFLRKEFEQLESDGWAAVLELSPKSKAITAGGTRAEKERSRVCEEAVGTLLTEYNETLGRLTEAHARDYFRPYALALSMIAETLEQVKRTRGRLFIGDINKAIVRSLNDEVVPEIYFTLGARIVHYLIDEFQDTSPIQWAALSVLTGNALSEGGTLLIVGDTKQSIYGFRGADWQIMMNLIDEKERFPSAPRVLAALNENRRSGEKIVLFTKGLFSRFDDRELELAARRSGLLGFEQLSLPDNIGKGVVEVVRYTRDKEHPPEREKILSIIDSALRRNYRRSDIAILTPRNQDVVEVSGWLNEKGIPFISHSSLDVRIQRVTTEMIALLQFLDSPIDDLAFATFILGRTFPVCCTRAGRPVSHDALEQFVCRSRPARRRPLYKAFQEEFPELWHAFFDYLFTIVGYAPLYDLVVEAYKVLDLFLACGDEGFALVKFLEVVKEFEQSGSNSIKDFLEYTGEDDEEGQWDIDSANAANAVRLMTVHKSKGLGYPIVIVLLSESRAKGLSPIIVNRGDGIELLHINGNTTKRSAELAAVYEEQRLKGQTEMLNALYVVLTRAKQELYVIALSLKEEAKVPCSLLNPCAPSNDDIPLAKDEPHDAEPVIAPTLHSLRRHANPLHEEALRFVETRRGDALHSVLAQLQFVEGEPDPFLDVALSRVNFPEQEREGVKSVLEAFLRDTGVRELFRPVPGRRVLNEQEFMSRTGDLFRADRIVVDADVLTVIDFKTGGEHDEEQYRLQIGNYMQLAGEIFGIANVRGCIAYVDQKKLTYVGGNGTGGRPTP